jgi:putative DNA primase/helicase
MSSGQSNDIWTYDPMGSAAGMPLPQPLGMADLINGEELTGLDAGNAARLFRMWRHCLRYSPDRKKWLIFWEGAGIWRWDETRVCLKMAQKTMFETYRQALGIGNDAVRKMAHRSLDLHRLEAMLKLAEPLLAIRIDQLDQHPDALVYKNGTLNLSTRELGPHRREDFITRRLEYNYEPEARAPTFMTFLSRALGWHSAMSGSESDELRQMIEAIQMYLGYCLTGRTSSKAIFIWHGPSNTGKTTMLSLFLQLLGSYGTKIQIESLMRGAEHSANAQSDLANLQGVRFAMTSEVEKGQRLNVQRLKSITQGGGRISATRKYENTTQFDESHKLNVDSNHLPVVPDDDDAVWTRLVVIPSRIVIPKPEQDHNLAEKLLAEAEGILNFAVQGSARWYNSGGRLDCPRSIREAGLEYRGAMNVVKQFLEDSTDRDIEAMKLRKTGTALCGCVISSCYELGQRTIRKVPPVSDFSAQPFLIVVPQKGAIRCNRAAWPATTFPTTRGCTGLQWQL